MDNTLKANIETEYLWFINENNKTPNIAHVKVQWKNEDAADDNTYAIVIDPSYSGYGVPYIHDSEVFYYCLNLDELTALTEDCNDDYKIVELVALERRS